jgi:hypothetical protein
LRNENSIICSKIYECFFLRSECAKSTLNNIESSINYLCANRNLIAAKWLSMVKDNSADYFKYNKVLKDGMRFRISDTFYIRGLSYFKDTLNYYGDSTGISNAEKDLSSQIVCMYG